MRRVQGVSELARARQAVSDAIMARYRAAAGDNMAAYEATQPGIDAAIRRLEQIQPRSTA